MQAVMQQPGQGQRSFAFGPLSDVIKVPAVSVLPKRAAAPSVTSAMSQQPQKISQYSPTTGSSPSTSPEENSSPTSPMSTSPPLNPPDGLENSQLPRPVVLPPRAKPGRKPATDTPASKRKAQNREAQRNFRDRKRQREHEVQEQVRQREQEHLEYIRRIQERHEEEMKQIRDQTRAAQEKERQEAQSQLSEQSSALEAQQRLNNELNLQVQELIRRQSSGASAQRMKSPVRRDSSNQKKTSSEEQISRTSSVPIPNNKSKHRSQTKSRANVDIVIAKDSDPSSVDELPEDPMEADFTNMGKLSQDNISPFIPLETPDDSCGFCDTNTYCACRDRMVNAGGPPLVRGDSYIKPPNTIEPSAAPVGPGGCQACLDDPERRRICLSMASRRQEATSVPLKRREPSRRKSKSPSSTAKLTLAPPASGVNRPTSGWQESHMTCTDAITYGQQNDPNFHENWNRPDFIQRLRVVKPQEGRSAAEPRNCSPQDVEIASIMAAMSASGDAGAKDRDENRLLSSRALLSSLKEEKHDG